MSRSATSTESDIRWLAVLVFYLLTALWAVAQLFVNSDGIVTAVFAVAFAFAATSWVILDARIRRKPVLHIVQSLIFFLWPLAVPAYVITTRRFVGLGWLILNAIGLLVVTLVCFYGAIYLYWGPPAFGFG